MSRFGSADSAGDLTLAGTYGVLTVGASGHYSYAARDDAPEGAVDRFAYTVRDGDGDQGASSLTVTIAHPAKAGGEGQALTSDRYGDHLAGGAGADTLTAGQGPDQLTGAGGADVFAFHDLPWNAGHVTDFAVGEDRLDLSDLLQASGYAGSDPVADGYVLLRADGAGGTEVYVDTNGPAAGGDWPFHITTLDGVGADGLGWSQLAGGAAAGEAGAGGAPADGEPSGEAGRVLASSQYADTLSGGAGPDTLNAGRGPDQLTGGGGDDHFVFDDLPWNAGHVTDFAPGQDLLDLGPLFDEAGYGGADPLADGWLAFRPDGAGGTEVYVDVDGPDGGAWPFRIVTLDGVSPGRLGPGDWTFQ